jgi:hypothetical protein
MKFITPISILALMLVAATATAAPRPPPMKVIPKSESDMIRFFEIGRDYHSAVIDVAVVIMADIHGPVAPPPPPPYDGPYEPVRIVADLSPEPDANGGILWGKVDMPTRKGGVCIIHVVPLWTSAVTEADGIYLADPIAYEALKKHELGHCHRAVHPVGADGDVDHSKWVPADRTPAKPKTAQRPRRSTASNTVAPAAPGSW